jgi:ribulose-5-phosphate 4-epimerase/fuculose-1-phosphate aldolase
VTDIDRGAGAMTDARKRLATAGRQLGSLGLSPGASGNISKRLGGHVVISPTGADLANLTEDGLVVLDRSGERVSGGTPSKEASLHIAMYRRIAQAKWVVHLHSPYATAVSCLQPWSINSAIPPITPYFVMRVGQTPLIPYATPGDAGLARYIEELDVDFHAALLQNHGLIAAGETFADTLAAITEIEATCAVLLRLNSCERILLPDGEAERLAERYGTPWTP